MRARLWGSRKESPTPGSLDRPRSGPGRCATQENDRLIELRTYATRRDDPLDVQAHELDEYGADASTVEIVVMRQVGAEMETTVFHDCQLVALTQALPEPNSGGAVVRTSWWVTTGTETFEAGLG